MPTRRDMLKATAAAAVGAFARPARAAAPEPSPVTPALIEAARKEGKAVWYAAMDLPVSERVARGFEAKYPGIAVRIERTGSERQFQRLALEQAAIDAAGLPGEHRVRALLDDLAAIEHQDAIEAAHRRQPMRDHDRGAALHQPLHRLLDQRLGFRIQARCRLVQDQHREIGRASCRERV